MHSGVLAPDTIKAPEVYLAWVTGSSADEERQKLVDGLGSDPNSGLIGVASGYWITYCAYKCMERFSDVRSMHLTLEKMNTLEFKNALRKYVEQAATMFYDAAVDTYDRDDYGSFKRAQFYLAVDDPTGRLEERIGNNHLTPSVWGWNDGSAEVRAA